MNEENEIDIVSLYKIILLRKKLFFSIFILIFFAGSFLISYRRIFNPLYKGNFSLLISNPIEKKPSSGSSSSAINFASLATNSIESDIPTLKYFLKSPSVLLPLNEKLTFNKKIIAKNINISLGGDKQIARGVLEISYKGSKPSEVREILDLLGKTYKNIAKEERKKRLIAGLEFLNAQYPKYLGKQEEFQTQLAKFREKNKLVNPIIEAQLAKDKISESENKLKSLRDNKNLLINFKIQIEKGSLSALGFKSSVVLNDSSNKSGFEISDADQSRFDEITNLEKQLSSARTKYKPSSIMVSSLLKKYDSLKPELVQIQVNAVDKAIEINEISIKRTLDDIKKFKSEFELKPSIIRDFSKINQNLEIAQNNVLELLNARENFQMQLAQQSSPWKILSAPDIEEKPFSPKVGRSLLILFFFSILISIIVIFIRDKMDKLFHSTDELKRYLNQTIIGNIPYIETFDNTRNKQNSLSKVLVEMDSFEEDDDTSKEDIKQKRYEKFIYQESFRNLYTSIRFANVDNSLKKLLITSSIPKEGKSLINIVLAKTLADIGLRVLLIDADMRKPQVHKRLGINNIIGFSNLLIDKKNDLKNTVQNIQGIPNLDILTSGRSVPDTTRLLRSDRMRDFIKELEKEDYDFILFDSPPILGISDGNLISEYCDGIILIVSIENVNKNLPSTAIESINKSSNFLGVIANGTKNFTNKGVKGYGYNTNNSNYSYTDYIYESYSNETNIETKNKNKFILKVLIEKIQHILKWLDE